MQGKEYRAWGQHEFPLLLQYVNQPDGDIMNSTSLSGEPPSEPHVSPIKPNGSDNEDGDIDSIAGSTEEDFETTMIEAYTAMDANIADLHRSVRTLLSENSKSDSKEKLLGQRLHGIEESISLLNDTVTNLKSLCEKAIKTPRKACDCKTELKGLKVSVDGIIELLNANHLVNAYNNVKEIQNDIDVVKVSLQGLAALNTVQAKTTQQATKHGVTPQPPSTQQNGNPHPPNHNAPRPNQTAPPPNQTAPPPNQTAPPPNHTAAPPNHAAPPPNHAGPPPNHVAPPPNHVAHPPNHSAPSPNPTTPLPNHNAQTEPQNQHTPYQPGVGYIQNADEMHRDATTHVDPNTEILTFSDSLTRGIRNEAVDSSGKTQIKTFGGHNAIELTQKISEFSRNPKIKHVFIQTPYKECKALTPTSPVILKHG